ncbi:MAG: hypothetical protein ABJA79_01540 [Parafilimonas sp.]
MILNNRIAKWKIIVILSIFVMSACLPNAHRRNSKRNNNNDNSDTVYNSNTTARSSLDPGKIAIGALVSSGAGNIKDAATRLKAYQLLNVTYVRHGIFMNAWNGSNAFYNTLQNAGYKIILNVAYLPQGAGPQPFPTNLEEYKRTLNDILSTYKPEVVVIENEEYNPTYHTGTAQQYINELKVAIEVAHSIGLKVTNGGLTARVMTMMVWKDYRDRGLKAEADNFARRTMSPDLLADLPELTKHKSIANGVRQFNDLLEAYKNLDIDYINFHWYEPIGQRTNANARTAAHIDTKALGEAIEYIQRKTGKPVITNEIGQFNQSPDIVKDILEKCVELKLPYIIWYSGDGGEGKAVALTNLDGSMRENGRVFADFVKQHQ